jgi:AcrR family transcriptional regulator
MPRLNRMEQMERNRGLVLAAARRVFLERGYSAATVEAIADAAGFSKGVIYSQFESKADLFLALLDERISERAAENAAVTRCLAGREALAAMLRRGRDDAMAEPGWPMLLIEFRTQAARDPALAARYARAHARTVEQLAAIIEGAHQRAGLEPIRPPAELAWLVLALGAGLALEQSTDPELPRAAMETAGLRLLGL